MTRQEVYNIVPTVAVCMIEAIRHTLPKHSKQHREIEELEGQICAFSKKLGATKLDEEIIDRGVQSWKAAMGVLGVKL